MATFSQQFLSNLGTPRGMLAGAAQLGQALGSAPGLIAERNKKRETLARTSAVSQLLTQGIEYANTGNQEKYNSVVAGLQNKVETATDPEEQKIAQQALSALNQQRRVLDTNVEKSETNEVTALLRELNDSSDPALRNDITQQINTFSEDVRASARGIINNENTYTQNLEEKKQQAYLKRVQPDIAQGVKSNDPTQLAEIVKEADTFGIGLEARAMINGLQTFEDRQNMLLQQQKLNKVGPIDKELRKVVENTLDTFPQSAREGFKKAIEGPILAYEKHVKNFWDEKQGIWKTGGKATADKLEATVRTLMSRYQITNLTNNINTVSTKIKQAERNIREQNLNLSLINNNDDALRRQALTNLRNQLTEKERKKKIKEGTYTALIDAEAERLAELKRSETATIIQLNKAELFKASFALNSIGNSDYTISDDYNITEKLQTQLDKIRQSKGNEEGTDAEFIAKFIENGLVIEKANGDLEYTDVLQEPKPSSADDEVETGAEEDPWSPSYGRERTKIDIRKVAQSVADAIGGRPAKRKLDNIGTSASLENFVYGNPYMTLSEDKLLEIGYSSEQVASMKEAAKRGLTPAKYMILQNMVKSGRMPQEVFDKMMRNP